MYTKEQREAAKKWLVENVDSHGVFGHVPLAKSFKESVGKNAPWPTRTSARVQQMMRNRGKGGYVDNFDGLLCNGFEVAEAIAVAALVGEELDRYAAKANQLSGLGFRFHAALEAL